MEFYASFFFNDTATTEIYTLSLHDALPISGARLPRAPQREAVARRATLRRAQPCERVPPEVGAGEVEGVTRGRGVAHRQRRGDAPAVGQKAIEPDRAGDARGVVGQVARVFAELAVVGVAARDADGDVRHVGRRERDVHRARIAGILHHVAQADVVHP